MRGDHRRSLSLQAIKGGGDARGALGETALGSWSQHSNASLGGNSDIPKLPKSLPFQLKAFKENHGKTWRNHLFFD